jgi:histidinol-phosphate aminotransferase
MGFPIKTRTQVETIAPYVLGKSLDDIKKELGLTQVLKMSENENVYGCSPIVKETILRSLDNLHLYPDGAVRELRLKLAEYYKLDSNQFVLGNGSDELIRLLTRTFISPNDEAIMANVTFPRYQTNIMIEGGVPVIVPLINGKHSLKGMQGAITSRTKMIFICNPNNPTGTIVGKEELLTFIQSVPEDILVILDEAYVEYVTTNDYLSSIPLLEKHSNLVILRTFSKIYGLASLRMGYGIAHTTIVDELLKVKEVFNANGLAQMAALAALEDQSHIRSCALKNAEERIKMEHSLTEMGLSFFPSHTNFMMVDTKSSGEQISNELLKQGIVVRSGHLLGYPSMFRVTLGTITDNETFLIALKNTLAEKVV